MTLNLGRPLVTVACNEDMTASNLIERCLLDADGTPWQDGPLTFAARHGAICDLDDVAEARQDTTVAIHPRTDDRRVLPLEKKGELLRAHDGFLIVISDDPGCQSLTKALKQSTKQRLGAMDFTRPAAAVEARIAAHAADNDAAIAQKLVEIGARSRNRKGRGLDEGVSTRMLIYAGRLIRRGVAAPDACTMALVHPITDDPDLRDSLHAAIAAWFR